MYLRRNAIVCLLPLSRGDWRSRWSKGMLKTITGIIDRIFRSDSLSVWQGCNESWNVSQISQYNIIVFVCMIIIFFFGVKIYCTRGNTVQSDYDYWYQGSIVERRDVYRSAIFVVFLPERLYVIRTRYSVFVYVEYGRKKNIYFFHTYLNPLKAIRTKYECTYIRVNHTRTRPCVEV